MMNKYYTVKIYKETFNWDSKTTSKHQIIEKNFAIKEDAENFGKEYEKRSYKPCVSIDNDYSYFIEENQSNKAFFKIIYSYINKDSFTERYRTVSDEKYFQSNQDLNSFINENKESLKGFSINSINILFFE